jgi:hypothetical protein
MPCKYTSKAPPFLSLQLAVELKIFSLLSSRLMYCIISTFHFVFRYGLQALSADMAETRQIASKLAEKIKRSKAVLLSQHIGRAMLGLQRLSPDAPEVKVLLKEFTKRLAASDRTRMTATAIADSLYGLQGMNGQVTEVQELVGELAKKIASTGAEFTPSLAARVSP